MSTLVDALSQLPERPLGCVVHLGAGRGAALEACAALQPQRLLLVEGDPDAATELRRRAAALAGARVVGEVVMPQSGAVAWHRHNLASLDGPVEVTALGRYYPRLQHAGALPRQAVALADLLDDACGGVPTAPAARPDLLVIDLPGQEEALIASLPPHRLQAFGWVLLRGCREPLQAGGPAVAAALARLQRLCFIAVEPSVEPDPLWPVTLLRFDRARYEVEQLRERVARLEGERGEREAAVVGLRDTLSAEREAHALQTAEQRRHTDALVADLATHLQQLAAQRAELSSLRDTARALEQDLAKAVAQGAAALTRREAEVARQVAALESDRDQQALQATERLAALTGSRETASQLEADQKRMAQELAEATRRCEELRRDASTLAAARDEQARLAAARGQRLGQIEGELADLTARHQMLQEELIKAEAQTELIADLLLREVQL